MNKLVQQGRIYEEKDHGNVCFVGFDKSGTARYCAFRGCGSAQFRGEAEGSDKRYGFCIEGSSRILKVFESPIDAISHATFAKYTGKQWNADTRLSLAGLTTKALEQHLADYPDRYDTIWFCFDNDKPGQDKAQELANTYADRGFRTKIKTPLHKDWNEDLQRCVQLAREQECNPVYAIRYVYAKEPIPFASALDDSEAEQELCRAE